MPRPQFSLKTMLWLTLVVVALGFVVHMACNPIMPTMTFRRL